MTPGLALWAPATTPSDPAVTRRHLRPRPSAWGLAAVAALAAMLWLVTREPIQLAVGVAAISVVVLDGATARHAMRQARVEVATGHLTTTSDPLECTLWVGSTRRPVAVAPATRPAVQHFLVEPDRPGRIVLAPRRRGVVHALTFDVTVTGPMGLFECARRMRVPLTHSLLVAPATLPHDVHWPRIRAVATGMTDTAPVGDELYRTVRPYVRGDSRRRVHWKATAHRGTLMVKETDGTGVVALQVVVQLDGPGAPAEVALSRATWIVREALARGWRVELVTVQPRTTPVAPAGSLGSPFGPPPLDLVPVLETSHVVRRHITSERAAMGVLALAGYGPVDAAPERGTTCYVTVDGERWT